MNQPNAKIVTEESAPETPRHEHEFGLLAAPEDLTTPQTRKLIFYQGPVYKCLCGVIGIPGGSSGRFTAYSRNGSRI